MNINQMDELMKSVNVMAESPDRHRAEELVIETIADIRAHNNALPTQTCSCGGVYPCYTSQGPTSFCPFCGARSQTALMSSYMDKLMSSRRVASVLRRTSLRFRMAR